MEPAKKPTEEPKKSVEEPVKPAKKPVKLTPKQRAAVAELNNVATAFQNEHRKKISVIVGDFEKKAHQEKVRMSDLVRPIQTKHIEELKKATRQHKQDARNLERRFSGVRKELQLRKTHALSEIENSLNMALREHEDVRDAAVTKAEAELQVLIDENMRLKQEISGDQK